jgi:hypothetical protein
VVDEVAGRQIVNPHKFRLEKFLEIEYLLVREIIDN